MKYIDGYCPHIPYIFIHPAEEVAGSSPSPRRPSASVCEERDTLSLRPRCAKSTLASLGETSLSAKER